jgi:tetratricopeptide (TPR) repeat protein
VARVPAEMRAGAWVTAATIQFASGDVNSGRSAFDQAQHAYTRLGRDLDACRSLLWKVVARTGQEREAASDPVMIVDLSAAEAAARSHGDAATLADVLLLKAGLQRLMAQPAVLALFEEALGLLQPLGPSAQLMQCHRALAIASKRAGDIDAAEPHYQKAAELARVLGDRVQESRAIAGLGQIAKARGALASALAFQTQALVIAVETGSQTDIASRETEIGTLHTQLGHYRAARQHLEAALRIGETGAASADELVFMLDGLASVNALTGDLETARQEWERAITLARERNLRDRLPFLLLHLAQLHMDIGEPGRARELAEEGLSVARTVGHRRAELPLLSAVAAAQLALGEHGAALSTSRTAADLARQIEPRYLWEIVRGEAAALHGLGRTTEALAALDSTIARFPEIPDSMRLGLALRLAGDLLLASGDPAGAERFLTRSLAVARAMGDQRREAYAELDLGKARLAGGDASGAARLLEQGLRYVESERARIAVSEERSGYQSRWYDDYVALSQAYARSRRPADAFATLERTRARELRELFGTRTPGLAAQVAPALAQALEQVEGELAETQAAQSAEQAQSLDQRSPRVASFEHRVDSLKTAWTELARRIEREAPVYSQAAGIRDPVSVSEVQRALEPGERLIAYMVGMSGFIVFDIGATRFNVTEIAIREDTLAVQVNALLASIQAAREPEWPELASALGGVLLGTCELAEDPPQRLYILPDGILHYLPFEILIAPGAADGDPVCLLERTEIIYANSATIWLQAAGRTTPGHGSATPAVAVFADPTRPVAETSTAAPGELPFARQEAQRIAAVFPGTQLFLGAEATEEHFFAALGRTPIIHVAAHAIVDDEHPDFSGIALAPGVGGDDGWVRAHEVLEHSCAAELTVLSACETGRGRLLRGEGLLGLARAFFLAGARDLVVTLWKVDDRAAADLMAEFYARLSEGKAPAAALRGAKLGLWHGGPAVGVDSPSRLRGIGRRTRAEANQVASAWAAFVLIGSRAR